MVPAGSIITYQAKCQTGWAQSPDNVAQEINVQLSQSNVAMRDYTTSAIGVTDVAGQYIGVPVYFELTATLQTNVDFNSIDDVRQIIDHAVYMTTDNMPVSSVPNVTLPGAIASSTGQPSQAAPAIGGTASSWFSNIFQSGINSFALLMVGVILAVVLIVAGKHRAIL